ncbi:MAG TPA: M15 family metallopeptidase [Acidimicrobiales bacterium]|nr:M15 family metallopeptidase [Acidimicrobiales bacterium]
MTPLRALLLVAALAAGACEADGGATDRAVERAPRTTAPSATEAPTPTPTSTPLTTTTTTTPSTAAPRPAWLGTRVLPVGPKGYAAAQPTPPELVDRRLETPDHLPPPDSDAFQVTVDEVPDDVLARSTWSPECPVPHEELRWVRLTFWGFDGRTHTGELLVHADAAQAVAAGFARLHERRFPIEEMRIASQADLDAPPTGDGNNTTAFVCRPTRGATSWSEHATGRAVDVNPFHNPYVKGDVVLPELATAYVDRGWHRPGMLRSEDVAAFLDAGWGWGGQWRSLQDWMHLSANDR